MANIDVEIKTQKGSAKTYPPVNAWVAFELFGQVGISIVLPLVAGVMIGAYVDSQWQSKPSATIAGLVIGLIISIVTFTRTVRQFMDRHR